MGKSELLRLGLISTAFARNYLPCVFARHARVGLVLDYEPDLVLELGRGIGNSTALWRYWGLNVVSVCQSHYWRTTTVPALTAMFGPELCTPVRAIEGNIAEQDYEEILNGYGRVLVFWDAHGIEVASVTLSRILPGHSEKIVVCHDLRDARCFTDEYRDYSAKWQFVGDVMSQFDQLIPIVDFCSRNRIQLKSPSEELRTLAEDDQAELNALGLWYPVCYWHYFQLTDSARFPR